MKLHKLSLILCFGTSVSSSLAVDYRFNVADGDWYTATNWTPNGVPQGGNGNHAFIDAGKTVTIAQDTDGGGSGFDIQDTFVGWGVGNSGTVNHTAGNFNINNGWVFIGRDSGTGTWNMSGTSAITAGNRVIVGQGSGGMGTLTMSGNSSIADASTNDYDNRVIVGHLAGSTGTVTMTGASSMLKSRIYVGGTRDDGSAGTTGNFNINTTGTITAMSDFSVGTRGAAGNVVMTNGTLNANTWAIIGETVNGGGGSTGSMTQNGGNVNFGATDAGGRLWIGNQENGSAGAASSGSYTLNGGNLTSRNVELGHGGAGYSGTFTQTGGYYHILGGNDDSSIAGGGGSTGTWTMSGGTADIDSHFQIGRGGSGTFNQTGGVMNFNQWPVIARFASSTGIANISGGTFNQANAGARLIVGEEGSGTANISGTANVVSAGGVSVGHLGASANGTLNLNGGTLTTPFIGQGSGTAKVNLNGGVLKASVNQAEFFNMQDVANGHAPTSTPMAASSVEIKAGGAKIDTNGFAIGTAVALNGVGSLTKQGAGTLTLNGITTHTGGTFVTGGTLTLSATGGLGGAGQIDVAAGATLNASASGLSLLAGQTLTGQGNVNGNVNIGPGTLAIGNSIGTQEYTNDLTLGATSISNFEIIKLTLPDADLADVAGTLTLGGTINVTSLGGTFANGDTFNLFDGPVISGNFSTVNLPATTGNDYWVNNLASDGSITFVPEPSSVLLGLSSIALLARRRRRA
jgi:fibronectin-binding autotransporter adhesin